MKTNRKNPYQTLRDTLREYADKVEHRRRKTMWVYPKAKLGDNWRLNDLAERVAAAEQLGYETFLEMGESGLTVIYREKAPARPWEARYD